MRMIANLQLYSLVARPPGRCRARAQTTCPWTLVVGRGLRCWLVARSMHSACGCASPHRVCKWRLHSLRVRRHVLATLRNAASRRDDWYDGVRWLNTGVSGLAARPHILRCAHRTRESSHRMTSRQSRSHARCCFLMKQLAQEGDVLH